MTSLIRGAARRLRRTARDLTKTSTAPNAAFTAAEEPDPRHQALRVVRAALKATDHERTPVPSRPGLTVAVAASSRLSRSLAWEWNQIDVDTTHTAEELAADGAEFLLVELHAGIVPGWGKGSGPIADLAAGAQASGLPVFVWVTAGSSLPEHIGRLASHATAVFIVDAAALPAWRERWPDITIEELAPAAAPMVHSPAHGGASSQRPGDIVLVTDESVLDDESLAGLENLLVPATAMPALPDVHVWRSRIARRSARPEPVLPQSVKDVAVGSTVADLTEPVVDNYRVVLDLARCAPDSTWTLVEAGAAQSSVVTLPSYRSLLPGDLGAHVGSGDTSTTFGREVVARLSQHEMRDRESLRLRRAVMDAHTFAHRVDTMLTTLGRHLEQRDRSVSVVVPTNRDHEIDNVLANVARQSHRDVELILVLHGLRLDHAELKARATELGIDRFQVIEADEALPLGAVMNLGVDAASGRYTAKMDDDNIYGRHYLSDLVSAFDSTGAGIVGKWAHYVWLRSVDAVILRYEQHENQPHRLVQGGSILVDSDLAKDLRFSDIPRAVDTDFLNRAWAAGVKTYSADRFNFISVRGSDHEQHTWKVTDTEMMLGGAKLLFYGDPRPHVEV